MVNADARKEIIGRRLHGAETGFRVWKKDDLHHCAVYGAYIVVYGAQAAECIRVWKTECAGIRLQTSTVTLCASYLSCLLRSQAIVAS